MTNGFNTNLWNRDGYVLMKQSQVEQNFRNGMMYETHKIDGQVVRVSVFEDLNKDNMFTNDEITQVEQYTYRKDGTLEKRITYYDKNKDGYSDDNYIIDKYNEYGDFESVSFVKNKSIEELKKQAENGSCCDKTALNNRKMTAHKDGNDKWVCY